MSFRRCHKAMLRLSARSSTRRGQPGTFEMDASAARLENAGPLLPRDTLSGAESAPCLRRYLVGCLFDQAIGGGNLVEPRHGFYAGGSVILASEKLVTLGAMRSVDQRRRGNVRRNRPASAVQNRSCDQSFKGTTL
jgi:hypothetical protein